MLATARPLVKLCSMFFDSTACDWDVKTELCLAYLYSINIVGSKQLQKLFIAKLRDFTSFFVSGQNSNECSNTVIHRGVNSIHRVKMTSFLSSIIIKPCRAGFKGGGA